jgi:hypothetical protein
MKPSAQQLAREHNAPIQWVNGSFLTAGYQLANEGASLDSFHESRGIEMAVDDVKRAISNAVSAARSL